MKLLEGALVTGEMVAKSDKHAAELLDLLESEEKSKKRRGGASKRGGKGNKKEGKGNKKGGKNRK